METLKTDIVVIGSGAAGMAAALTAAEGGAKVIVFEKGHGYGGISNLAREIFAVESNLQRDKNIPFTRDEAFKIFMEHTHWRADARLVRAYIDKTASTIDWLQQQGVEFYEIESFYLFPEMQLAAHLPKPSTGVSRPGATATMMKILRDRAEEKGVEIRLANPVKKIVKKANGVDGVIAETKSGETIQVKSRAVIVASGGYLTNEEMLKTYGGFSLNVDLFMTHSVKLPGDGIQMAWDAGAASDGMFPQLLYDVPVPALDNRMTLKIIEDQPYLWINQQGKRFFDEGIVANSANVANAMARQKNKCAYLIFDENTKKYMKVNGIDIVPGINSNTNRNIDVDSLIREAGGKGAENIMVSDSLKELSGKIGVDPNTLNETIDEYNKFCEKGHDDLFAKNPRYLQPVKRPKFYAFRLVIRGLGTLGGIKINEKTEVLNKQDEVIPGLYAAGDCANGALSHDYSVALILRGGAIGFALNSGRIAGENILKYIGL